MRTRPAKTTLPRHTSARMPRNDTSSTKRPMAADDWANAAVRRSFEAAVTSLLRSVRYWSPGVMDLPANPRLPRNGGLVPLSAVVTPSCTVAAKARSTELVCRCAQAWAAVPLRCPANCAVAVWNSPDAWMSVSFELAGPSPSSTKMDPWISALPARNAA